jgi:hypothetical protein
MAIRIFARGPEKVRHDYSARGVTRRSPQGLHVNFHA